MMPNSSRNTVYGMNGMNRRRKTEPSAPMINAAGAVCIRGAR